MERKSQEKSDPHFYLIWGEFGEKQHCYKLHPDQIVNIGRASTNRIVLRDDVCSRTHCEVFHTSSGWNIRDRNSRNGTSLNGEPIKAEMALIDGDLIRLGSSYLLFTKDPNCSLELSAPEEGDTETELRIPDESSAPPQILHSQKESTLAQANVSEQTIRQRAGLELSRLYQMALKMANTDSTKEVSEIVLDGLVGITGADIGAVMVHVSFDAVKIGEAQKLVTTAYRSLEDQTYRPVSSTLTQQVLDTAEAILAHNLTQNKEYVERDSIDNLQAESLIVAPIRSEERVFGLIHLYSTNPENALDTNDLDYTLAVADQLAVALQNLHERHQLEDGLLQVQNENQQLKHQLAIETELVGQSSVMEELKSQIGLIAPTDAVVLIRGESGAGKELVARAIHYNSERKEEAFVCMNCAALSESLLESELFGHEKGSFTGATDQKKGKFEQADQGTLFLDEVGEMSQAIQAKFLRVLEGHPFERVGGSESIKVDVRLVAATNRDLEEAVRESKFREDLYFRLQVLEVIVPPLRERDGDIPILANFFAERFAERTGRPAKEFSSAAMNRLCTHHWSGNVRELQNAVERAVVLSTENTINESQIHLSGLRQSLNEAEKAPEANNNHPEMSMEELERQHILRVLENTKGNKSKASAILGFERSTLDRKLKKYGLAKKPG